MTVKPEPVTSLLEDWHEFERNILPADFGEAQRRKCKFAFYSGAMRVVDKLMMGASADVQTILGIHIELDKLSRSIAEDHL